MAVFVFSTQPNVRNLPLTLVKIVKTLSNSLYTFPEETQKPAFGILFDIDGVIVRGKKVLPSALEAFWKLINSNGAFRVPTVFVTNAGNGLRHDKAQQLSEWLGVHVHEEQVVMAHSPLRMFHQFHNKHILVSGQGPIVEIAKNLGFQKITTLEQLRHTFPALDAVDHKRRITVPCAFEQYFPPVEAVVLFGEPVRWETALQLLIDILMTDGQPAHCPNTLRYPHLPILACNMDLQWMAEAGMPRFGHGAFLLCLETLYKKITGLNLIYTALIGKPSEITYHHAHCMVLAHARDIGIKHNLKRLYAVGDNIYTDVFGANLYNQYLSKRENLITRRQQSIEDLLGVDPHSWDCGAVSCSSILVETGVYSPDRSDCESDHSPRDFLPVEEKLREPVFTVENVCKAIDLIFQKENFNLPKNNNPGYATMDNSLLLLCPLCISHMMDLLKPIHHALHHVPSDVKVLEKNYRVQPP